MVYLNRKYSENDRFNDRNISLLFNFCGAWKYGLSQI